MREQKKQGKIELLGVRVAPELMERFDRAIDTLPAAESRSQVIRYLVERFVEEREAGHRQPAVT